MSSSEKKVEESTKKRKSLSIEEESISTSTSAASISASTTATTTPKKKKKLNKKSSTSSTDNKNNSTSSSSSNAEPNNTVLPSFKPYTLSQIQSSITKLSAKIPIVPEEGLDPNNKTQVREWTMKMQAIVEEFNLLLTCISAATYKWGTDRTGAADQNLSLLSNELGNAQEQISLSVTPRLTNVLAPVVELITKETMIEKIKDDTTGEVTGERRIHTFAREENDPKFIHLCHIIVCRNATMLRHVVLTNFFKVGKCIQDYLNATQKDGNHNRSAFY
jgi:hypothetical protein